MSRLIPLSRTDFLEPALAWRKVGRLVAAAVAVAALLAWESVAVDPDHWARGALAAGLATALGLRWHLAAWVGAAAGFAWVAATATAPGTGAQLAHWSPLLAALSTQAFLRWQRVESRLERARDVAWLAAASLLILAPLAVGPRVAALGLPGGTWFSIAAAMLSFGVFATMAALPALLIDRQTVLYPQVRRPRTLALALAALTVLVTVLPISETVRRWHGADLLDLLAPALLLALLHVGGLPQAAATLALAGMARLGASDNLGFGAACAPGSLCLDFSGPLTIMLASLLVVHAARASANWRESRWEWALDGTGLGVAEWQLDNGRSFVSAAWSRLTGQSPGRWTPSHWLRQVHADDRSALEEALSKLSAGEEGRRQLELRMPSGGGWRWVEATLLVVERDSLGHPVRLLATVSNVDERHEARQRQRLSASLFQHLQEGLLITDEQLRTLDVNPAFTRILGVSREDAIGQVPSLLRSTSPDPVARQQRASMLQALRHNGSWRGELVERRAGGELCTLQATISTVPGNSPAECNHVVIISDITEQQLQRERLERQAHFDELTRLPNRLHLSRLLSEAMHAADRDGYLLAVCYLDLDHFKPVNDHFGHAAGDGLLAELAGRLRAALRTRESWADVAARLGGDEFVLLLRAGTLEEARLAVERVLQVVAQPYLVGPEAEPVQVTASMGATVYPIDRSDADTLLRHADHAMYGAKQSGRNGYLFFDPEHRRRTEERVMAIGRVQEALDQSEFVLHYQPKVDMRSGEVLGLEALLRWEHPQHGLVAPLQFLPLIENTGLSSRVGDWALAQALDHLAQWRRAGLAISVSVNISARHLQEPDFTMRLSELLARYPEKLAGQLELEILESAAHSDIDATSALISRCRALGVRFALDDFGTGYSTLTYLKRLPVNTLKIDRSFVHHMLDDAQDRAIVEGVIGLAGTFGCTVVAEGVESPAQAGALLEMGCRIGQGNGIAAPMPVSEVVRWVQGWRGLFETEHDEGSVHFPS